MQSPVSNQWRSPHPPGEGRAAVVYSKGDLLLLGVAEVWRWIATLLRLVWGSWGDSLWRWLTGKSNVERILSEGPHSPDMTARLRRCIEASSRLRGVHELISAPQPFDVNELCNAVLRMEVSVRAPMFRDRILPNLCTCMTQLNTVCIALGQAEALRATAFDTQNASHEAMLDTLWKRLRPGVEREGRLTTQWGVIGFQGRDPATDFRGMGMLGLTQLAFLASTRTARAQRMVDETQGFSWYPFAITGIQLTSFTLQLLRERRLDAELYGVTDDFALEMLHVAYCSLFERFHATWMQAAPENVLAFPHIFASFEREIREAADAGELRRHLYA